MNDRLLFLDTETGGVNPEKHSLLSIGIVVWEKGKGEIFSKEMCIKDTEYHVTKSAIRINHFNKDEHEKKAVSPEIAIELFYEIKANYFAEYSFIPLAGHNISFDVQFLNHFFSKNGRSFEKLFLHRFVDTYSIIKFLVDCNKIPTSINSSASAFKFYGIKVDGRHTALGDARATMQLYEKMLQS